MTQPGNTSSAVRAQRHEPHDSLDFFPTPPWATRALMRWLERQGEQLNLCTAWDPACGQGDMARPLGEEFDRVTATDVHDYGGQGRDGLWRQDAVEDFLMPGCPRRADWIITNPPFRLGEQFITTALERADRGVAMLLRTQFLEGVNRWRTLFSLTPPHAVLQFVERVPMFKGQLDPEGSAATAYVWLVWGSGSMGPTALDWLPPCRAALERPGDYPTRPAPDPAPAPLLGN